MASCVIGGNPVPVCVAEDMSFAMFDLMPIVVFVLHVVDLNECASDAFASGAMTLVT
jgi:hypothetical protein